MLHIIEPGIKGYVEKKRFGLFCCFFAAFGIIMTRSFFLHRRSLDLFTSPLNIIYKKTFPGTKKPLSTNKSFMSTWCLFCLLFDKFSAIREQKWEKRQKKRVLKINKAAAAATTGASNTQPHVARLTFLCGPRYHQNSLDLSWSYILIWY